MTDPRSVDAMREALDLERLQLGQPAVVLPNGWERIGPAACPLMYRKTLISCRLGKVMLHHFPPNARDHDAHDHPSSFLTLIYRGGYDDLTPCPKCDDASGVIHISGHEIECPRCRPYQGGRPTGFVVERLRAPTVRFRRAEHAHVTHVHDDGARSLVIMFRKRRPWGFLRGRRWYFWQDYERRFGMNFRCD